MIEGFRPACRLALAVALALLIVLIFKVPHSFRALLAVSLLANLTTFRKQAMKQRLALTWVAGLMGIVMESAFRDAPWLYLPAYTLLIYATMLLASRSRDAATMTLVIYGLSGSLITADDIGSAPVMGGFYRTLGVTIGILSAATAFALVPLRKSFHPPPAHPVYLGRRDAFFLALVGSTCLCFGLLVIPGSKVFVVMGGATWAIQLLTASGAILRQRLFAAVLGSCVAIAVITVFSASSNNVALYLILVSGILGIGGYFASKHPRFKPGLSQFSVAFVIPISIAMEPLHSFHGVFGTIEAMWLGILVATLAFFLYRGATRVENAILPETAAA